MSSEQREGEPDGEQEGPEEVQDSPITSADDVHLYDNQVAPGSGQCILFKMLITELVLTILELDILDLVCRAKFDRQCPHLKVAPLGMSVC